MAIRVEQFDDKENNMSSKKAEVVGKVEKFIGGWSKLDKEQIKEIKDEFIESYFIVKFVDYGKPSAATFHKLFDFVTEPATEKSRNYIRGLYNRYSFRFDDDREAFMGEVAYAVTSAVYTFNESQDTYDYSKMNEVGSSENERIHAYLVKRGKTGISPIESVVMFYTNFDRWKKMDRNGDIDELPMSSFDEVIEVDGEPMYRHEVLGSDDSIFHTHVGNVFEEDSNQMVFHSKYAQNHLIVWLKGFMEEQKKLRSNKNLSIRATAYMTTEQLIYYEKMKDIYIGALEDPVYEGETVKDENGRDFIPTWRDDYNEFYDAQQKYYYNRAIQKAVLKAYNEQFPYAGLSFLKMRHEAEGKILDELLSVVNDGKTLSSSINNRVSQWISKNFDDKYIQDIINNLDDEDINNIINAKKSRKKLLPHQTLYNFINAVDDRFIAIAPYGIEKFYKRDDEFIEGSKKKALKAKKKRDEKRKAMKQSPMYIYNRDGEIIDCVAYEDQPKRKEYKVKRTQPNGARVEIDLNSDEDNF